MAGCCRIQTLYRTGYASGRCEEIILQLGYTFHVNYPPAKGSGFPPTTNERILFMKIAQDFGKSWAILFTVLTVEFQKL